MPTSLPIFGLFVGIGGSNYGIPEKHQFDARAGCRQLRFFALDDLHSISGQVLYDRLLGEFSQGLQAAKIKNIVC